jgi:phosphate transport system permease protein
VATETPEPPGTPEERSAEREAPAWFPDERVNRWWGKLFEWVTAAATLFGLVTLALLLIFVVVDAFSLFSPAPAWLDLQFLTDPPSRFPENAGIYPALVGSIYMTIVIAVLSFPIGVGGAIYLEEYTPNSGLGKRLTKLIEVNISNLAGVPSVVYGILGLALFVRTIGMPFGTLIVGAFTVGLLILPIVIISSQEAIRAVPDSFRQASYGMGATRWQTVRNVVLPRAIPGILTGTILSLGRAIGETAPLIMIGAPATLFAPPEGLFSVFSAMPRQLFAWSDAPGPEFQYGVLAAGVVTLLTVLLAMNSIAIYIRYRYEQDN